jgi:hypothetical protein
VTYVQGQRANLRTSVADQAGTATDATVVLTITDPDGTVSTPTVNRTGTGQYNADVTFNQPGDWLRVWTTSGTVVSSDVDQVHVIAPSLRIVGLAEVKEHGNITSTASDRELLDFIGTAQQMIEDLVGPTVPQTYTQTWTDTPKPALWLDQQPVLAVTSVTEYGNVVDPGLYSVNTDGSISRVDRRCWYGTSLSPLAVVYRAGRAPIAEGIRWAAKELTVHLWRSTQAQRGGRARGDVTDLPAAGYGLPNRVREALEPFLLLPAVG